MEWLSVDCFKGIDGQFVPSHLTSQKAKFRRCVADCEAFFLY